MDTGLAIALFAGLGGMLGWGFADFFAKKTIDAIGDVTSLFWCQLIGTVPLAILFSLRPSLPQLSGKEWVYLAALGIWSGLSYLPTYIAFGKGKVSLLSPIFASYAVAVTILSATFFGEVIPFGRKLAFAIVFIGVVLISGDPRTILDLFIGSKKRTGGVKGLPEILTAICLYSLWLIALDRFINGRYWVPFLLVIRIFSAASLFVYAKASSRNLKVADSSIWKLLVIVGCFDVAAFGCVSYGFAPRHFQASLRCSLERSRCRLLSLLEHFSKNVPRFSKQSAV